MEFTVAGGGKQGGGRSAHRRLLPASHCSGADAADDPLPHLLEARVLNGGVDGEEEACPHAAVQAPLRRGTERQRRLALIHTYTRETSSLICFFKCCE